MGDSETSTGTGLLGCPGRIGREAGSGRKAGFDRKVGARSSLERAGSSERRPRGRRPEPHPWNTRREAGDLGRRLHKGAR